VDTPARPTTRKDELVMTTVDTQQTQRIGVRVTDPDLRRRLLVALQQAGADRNAELNLLLEEGRRGPWDRVLEVGAETPPRSGPPLLTAGDTRPSGQGGAPAPWLPADWQDRKLRDVRESAAGAAERAFLDAVLRETRGVIKDAAARCGIGPRSLYDRMQQHGLHKEDYKG
jgi:DNA-binding NtrC family response regulator